MTLLYFILGFAALAAFFPSLFFSVDAGGAVMAASYPSSSLSLSAQKRISFGLTVPSRRAGHVIRTWQVAGIIAPVARIRLIGSV
jgi:hypothetical protein